MSFVHLPPAALNNDSFKRESSRLIFYSFVFDISISADHALARFQVNEEQTRVERRGNGLDLNESIESCSLRQPNRAWLGSFSVAF